MRSEERPSPQVVCETCLVALLDSNIVVDLDTYGLYAAWEIGFAEAKGIPVIGFSIDEGVIVNARSVRRRRFDENFMHGWDTAPVFDSLDALSPQCEGKVVHVCGAFRNERAMEELLKSNVARTASRLILPKDAVDLGKDFPLQYPYRAKEHAVE